jgi:hypothetical protein
MGAVSIAFDMTITGALALPWLLLAIHLFYPDAVQQVPILLRWLRRVNQPAAVAVLLFAAAYSLGTAASRMAYDFFNDNDLHLSDTDVNLKLQPTKMVLLRVGVTEDRILASVYCQHQSLLGEKQASSALAGQIDDFESHNCMCWQTLRWHVRLAPGQDEEDEALIGAAVNAFGLQESAVLLKGSDATERLRQLHDQVMVLRGAAFNGMIALSLCLFAWGATVAVEKRRSVLRWILALVPFGYLLLALIAIFHHLLGPRAISDPPYMEFTLILLGVAGGWLVWKRPNPRVEKSAGDTNDTGDANEKVSASSATPTTSQEASGGQSLDPRPKLRPRTCTRWAAGVVVCGLLTSAAILGWWSTEVLYARQVIYSSDAPATAK